MTLLLVAFLLGATLAALLPRLFRCANHGHVFNALAYAARAQRKDAPGTPTPAPRLGFFLHARTLLYVHWQSWLPASGKPRAVVVLSHGVGEHCGRYTHVAAAFEAKGFAVFALDHIGHGKSEGDRLYVERFDDYVDCVITLSDLAQAQFPNLPLFLLGHSMGGLIAVRTMQRAPKRFKAVVLSAPALDVAASKLERTLAPVIAQVLPKLPMNAVDPKLLCHDQAVIDLYVNDPLNTAKGISASLGYELLNAISSAQQDASSCTRPLLVIRGADDQVCLRPGIQTFFDSVTALDKTFIECDGLFHEIFNEDAGKVAITRVLDWLNVRVGDV